MKLSTLLFSLIIAGSIQAFAGTTSSAEVNGLDGKNESINLAAIMKVENLVQSRKGDSNLSVNFLFESSGGSTDVSPKGNLYLTTFNISEMRDAQSVHRIAAINELISTNRLRAGVYEATVSLYDFDSKCLEWNGNIAGKMKIIVDARQLTTDVRRFKGVNEDFSRGTITTPISVERICLK